MDKVLNKPEITEFNKTLINTEETEILKNPTSPVFKCFNHTKTTKGSHLDSSDCDIPSYQVNQSYKSRTSSKYGNETSESILPFTPILSPIPVTSTVQFQPPSIHSLGTVAKNLDRPCQKKASNLSNCSRVQTVQPCGIYESLGMTDKDISWVSSMATPPPKNVRGSEFNTIEKATFFPEEKFQNIQPRALFSPTLDNDFGCHPIVFTSESDDNDDEEYKSNIRLSDVCATLKQLEVKSLDLAFNNSVEKISLENDCIVSPIIRTKKRKLGSVKKKKKGSLVISPENKDKYEFSVGENVKTSECETVKLNSVNNFLEDDSFQSMSFSGIDELCKTLVSEHSNTSSVSKVGDCDKTPVNHKENNIVKKFYFTKATNDIHVVSTMEDLHSYAKALEEGDKCHLKSCKVDQPLPETGLVRFDILNENIPKIDATKRLHSEISEENDQCKEKKLKKVGEDNSGWENVKQYLSESQLNISDGEIFRTVENLEKTWASQENKSEKLSVEGSQGECKEDKNNMGLNCAPDVPLENNSLNNNNTKHLIGNLEPFMAFTTASGSKISISAKALTKGREILRDCEENLELDKNGLSDFPDTSLNKISMPGPNKRISDEYLITEFSTGSGQKINDSTKTIKNTRTLFENKALDVKLQKFDDNLTREYLTTDSGKQVQTSDNTSEKANSFSELNDGTKQKFYDFTSDTKGFLTGAGRKIQVSAKALGRAKALMAECDKNEEDPNLENSSMDPKKSMVFHTVSDTSSKKKVGKPDNLSFEGFSTGSGKTIQVSAGALEKAKSLLSKCESEGNENSNKLQTDDAGEPKDQTIDACTASGSKTKTFHDEKAPDCPNICFSTAQGNSIKVSRKALDKANTLLINKSAAAKATCTDNLGDIPGSSSKGFTQVEPPLMGFLTAGGKTVKISEGALAKAKERMNDWDQVKPEDSITFTDDTKKAMKEPLDNTTKTTKSEESVERMSTLSEIKQSDDWDEIIPSWLHVYNTSPSMASERIELFPLICDEEGKVSNSSREYIVKSPILGSCDRFHGKKKKRKFQFNDKKESDEKVQRGFANKSPNRKVAGKRALNLPLDFSAPFKKIKFEEDVDLDIKSERALARIEQEKAIKMKQKVNILKGSHLNKKCSEKQMSWKEAVAGLSPGVHSEKFLKNFGILEDVLQINIKNAVSYRFRGKDFFGSNCTKNIKGIPVGDGCLLILDDDNNFGVEEVKRAFLASPGVQPNLVSQGWVENHFKWIIWKLANYEKCFPQYFGGSCLTVDNILLQLKYRYDREIDRNERSALKKILERDDTSIKRLVLCICGIQKVTAGEKMGYKLELTDGWYSCPAHVDLAMTRLIEEGKLCIGTKLVTQGAILVNCDQGVSPLENKGEAYLKISTNSTRRIRWDTKLGFQKNPENFPISLGSILPQGGPISRIDVIIVRIYPTLYMEKTSDGRHVTRNRRSEEKADSEYRRIQEQRMENICNEIQSELRKSANLDRTLKRNCLNTTEQIEDFRQLVETGSDPSDLQELVSSDQGKLFENLHSNQSDGFSRQLREKIEKKLEKEKLNKRNVSEFLRVKIVDFRKPDFNNPAILSVWNPNEDMTTLLSEGKVISLMNVTISNSSRLYKPLQINTTRQTKYRQIIRNVKYPARKLTKLKDVSSRVCPAFEEVDVVGIVTVIRDVSYGSRLSQVVYLTDLEMNFTGIVFWGSCRDFGWEKVLRIHSIVACSNLQWKKNYTHQDVPLLYVTDNSIFTENPKHLYLKEEIERLKKNMPQDKTNFFCKCEENLTIKLEDSKWRSNASKNSSGNDSNLRESTSRIVNGFESKPTASSTPIKPFSINTDPEEAEPSPIQKKIERLQCYGEPPSLIPLLVRNTTKRKFRKES